MREYHIITIACAIAFMLIIGIIIIIIIVRRNKEKFEFEMNSSKISYPSNTHPIPSTTDLGTQLDAITKNYFVNSLRPSIDIDFRIEKLRERISNINIKLADMNIKPKDELIFV